MTLEEMQERLARWESGEEYATGKDIARLKKDIRAAKKAAKEGPAPTSFAVSCQWTGIEFQANSARAKTHPAMKSTENWPSSYRQQYADTVRACGSFDHPDAIALRDEIIADLNAQVEAQIQRERDYKQARKDAADERESRRQLNALLRQHGYEWLNAGFSSEEDADFYAGFASAPIGADWRLVKDGQQVSVQQALRDILPHNRRAADWIKE